MASSKNSCYPIISMGKKNKKKKNAPPISVTVPTLSQPDPDTRTAQDDESKPTLPASKGLSLLQMKLQNATISKQGDEVVLDLSSETSDEQKKLTSIVSLPSLVPSPPSLLSLSYNLLSGSILECILGPDATDYYSRLVTLNIAENNLESLSGIESMVNLERLNASGNKLQDSSPLKVRLGGGLERSDSKTAHSAITNNFCSSLRSRPFAHRSP